MSHSGDWSRVLRDIREVEEEEERKLRMREPDPPCEKCEGTKLIAIDKTPPDWWNSGPIFDEIPCDSCPECITCKQEIDSDFHHSPFKLAWLGEDMVFCSRKCLGREIYRSFDESNKYYNSAENQKFRRVLIDSILEYDW